MRDNNRSRYVSWRRWLKISVSIVAVIALLVLITVNSKGINQWFASVLRLFQPILLGLALAYLLNPIFRLFERKLLRDVHPLGLRRGLSLFCAYLFLVLLFVLLILLIVPQLIASINEFSGHYPEYQKTAIARFNEFVDWTNRTLERFHTSQDFLHTTSVEEFNAFAEKSLTLSRITGLLQTFLGSGGMDGLIDSFGGVILFLVHLIFSFFISLYLLSTKEKRYAQVMRLRRAAFGDSVNAAITRVCTVADKSFGSFLEGKFLDSLIIGILCYVVLLIFRIPYPVLLAVIIGITNIVPIIGPIFGAIPTAVIVLLTDPGKVIPFLIIVLVIQQLDGNIIGPKILGSSNGVSSLCVLISITVMGKIWGLVGMIVGVPLFATVLELLRDVMETRLRKKGLPSAAENYYPGDSIVDPAQDMQSGSEKSLRRLERYVLHLRAMADRGVSLKRGERLTLWFYRQGRKWSVFPELSPEALMMFAAEETLRTEEETFRQTKD